MWAGRLNRSLVRVSSLRPPSFEIGCDGPPYQLGHRNAFFQRHAAQAAMRLFFDVDECFFHRVPPPEILVVGPLFAISIYRYVNFSWPPRTVGARSPGSGGTFETAAW